MGGGGNASGQNRRLSVLSLELVAAARAEMAKLDA